MTKYPCRVLIFLVSFGCLASISCQKTQQPGNKIVIGETIAVPSKRLNKDMIIDVYLPEGYAGKSDRYPVLITCQSHFLHVSGITADLAWKNGAPELIVASVRNYSSGDFIPEKIEGHPDSGGADRFIAFFRDELIPYLDARYRTHPFRIFYSGSFGGGFCVYMFLTQPDVFSAYLAATPAIDYEGGSTLIMDNLQSFLAKNSYQDRFLYLGSENEPPLIPLLDEFVAGLAKTDLQGLKWEYHPFFDEDHGSIANKVVYHGLRFIFSPWTVIPVEVVDRGVPAVRTYVTDLKRIFAYDIGISWQAAWRAAASYRNKQRGDDVIGLLKLCLEYHPHREMAWLELGRALESSGQFEEAKKAFETAYNKAVENSSPHLGIFKDALDKINLKLRQK